jgi:hypothetical protein
VELLEELGHISGEGLPERIGVDPMVDVVDQDPDVADVVPGDIGHRGPDLVGQAVRGIGDPADDGLARQPEQSILLPRRPPAPDELGSGPRGVLDVVEDRFDRPLGAQSGTASARIVASSR